MKRPITLEELDACLVTLNRLNGQFNLDEASKREIDDAMSLIEVLRDELELALTEGD